MKLKKALGQNFFTNENLAKKIITLVLETNPESVLEIGPGAGAFTSLLYPKVKQLTLVEKDKTLIDGLKRNFPNTYILNQDFLDLTPSELPKADVIYGSLPYNVSKKIIRVIVEQMEFKEAYFIIQREVAHKYTDQAPKNSRLATITRIFATVKRLFDIAPGNFTPQPKVTSSLVRITPNENRKEIQNTKELAKLIEQAYQRPRKKLRNNISADSSFSHMRAQELTLENFVQLRNEL